MATRSEEGLRERRPASDSALQQARPEPSMRQALVHLDQFSLGAFFKELFHCYKW